MTVFEAPVSNRAQLMPRTAFAYDVAMMRVGDMGLRAARFRVSMLCITGACVVAGQASAWAYLIVVFALIGGLLSVASNYWQVDQERHPTNAVSRWSLRITVTGNGRMLPDVPGTVEALSYLPLASIGPWLMPAEAGVLRLLAFAATLAWVASCVNAVFTDPAFYNPEVDPRWRIVDLARQRALWLVLIAAAALMGVPANWTDDERWIVAGMCVVFGCVQFRVNETDRGFDQARRVSGEREVAGRHTMVEAVHEMVGQPTAMLRVQLADDQMLLQRLDETVSDLEGGYSDVLSMETELDHDVDWPGRLQHRLRRLTRLYFTEFNLTYPEQLSRVDRMIAHHLLHNLAVNAANAGAQTCRMDLRRDGDTLIVEATDDGRPVNRAVWLRDGGGMRRMLLRLERTGPGAVVELVRAGGRDSTKLIVARWRTNSDTAT